MERVKGHREKRDLMISREEQAEIDRQRRELRKRKREKREALLALQKKRHAEEGLRQKKILIEKERMEATRASPMCALLRWLGIMPKLPPLESEHRKAS